MDPRLAPSLEGRHTVERGIGRGGTTTVYLARDVRHHRNVALKVLNPELKRACTESQTIVVHNWERELHEKTAAKQ